MTIEKQLLEDLEIYFKNSFRVETRIIKYFRLYDDKYLERRYKTFCKILDLHEHRLACVKRRNPNDLDGYEKAYREEVDECFNELMNEKEIVSEMYEDFIFEKAIDNLLKD